MANCDSDTRDMHASLFIAIALLAAICVHFLSGRLRTGRRGWRTRESAGKLYRQLLARLLGDRAAADRLIDYEREQAPDDREATLIQRALDRLERDRRR